MTSYITISNINRDDCEFLSQNYENGERLGKGAYCTVFEACRKGTKDCNYVLKISKYDHNGYEMVGADRMSKDYIKKEWNNEIEMMTILNECQDYKKELLVPKIYDAWYCALESGDVYFYIIMERFDGDLIHFLRRFKWSEGGKIASIALMNNLRLKMNIIHDSCKICLNDIKLANIFYRKGKGEYKYDFVFGDTGKSERKSQQECRMDLDNFSKMISEFDRALVGIKSGGSLEKLINMR